MNKKITFIKLEASNEFATDTNGHFYTPEEREPEKWMWVEALFGEETKDRLYVYDEELATWAEKGGEYFRSAEAEDKMSEVPDALLTELYSASKGSSVEF